MTKAWAENKKIILEYYQAQKLPLNQTMARMRKDHGFFASQRAYRQQFRNWSVSKYNRKERTPLPHHKTVEKGIRRVRSSSSSTMTSPAIYVTPAAKTLQDTPRPDHAHIARPDSIHGMPAMASPYSVVASPYPSPIPTPNSNFNDDGSMNHTREQYPYHGAHHAASREDKMQLSNNVSETSVMQVTMGRESPSSFLLLTADNSSTLKAAPRQHPHDAHKQHGDSSDYKVPYSYPTAFGPSGSWDQNSTHQKPSAYVWDNTRGHHSHMGLDSNDDYQRPSDEGPSSVQERTNQTLHPDQGAYHYPPVKSLVHSPSAFGDYNSEYQNHAKPYYGASQNYHEPDGKPRTWDASEATPVSSISAFETRRYHLLPSPPHSQEQPSSPKGAKAQEDRLSAPRILPLSPASIPEIMAQPSLQRGPPPEMQTQEHGSGYHSHSLSVTMDFSRPYDATYATSGSPTDPHSSPHESVASPAAMSTHSHASMYPSYHLV